MRQGSEEEHESTGADGAVPVSPPCLFKNEDIDEGSNTDYKTEQRGNSQHAEEPEEVVLI